MDGRCIWDFEFWGGLTRKHRKDDLRPFVRTRFGVSKVSGCFGLMSGLDPRARSTLPRMLKSGGMLAVQGSGVPGNACWGFGLAQVSGVSKFGLCRRNLG